MNFAHNIWFRVMALFGKRKLDAEMDEEMRLHLELLTEHNIETGMSPEEARYAAQRRFGRVEQLKERGRDERGIGWLEHVIKDLLYSLRVLRKSPVFALAIIVTLGVGIGANTAVFQLLNAVRLRALPVREPGQLAEIRIADTRGIRGNAPSLHPILSNPLWEAIRDRQEAFTDLLAFGDQDFNLAVAGEVRIAHGLWVSGDFFNALGVQPLLGRVFTPADDRRGHSSSAVVMSYAFWQREFGGDPAVIGKTLTMNGRKMDIIGVTPKVFSGIMVGASFDVALPIGAHTNFGAGGRLDNGMEWWLTVIGHLKPSWSVETATAHLSAISSGIFKVTLPVNYPAINVKDYLGFKLAAYPAASGIFPKRDSYVVSLGLLQSLAGLVLLIACANIANLMLARASAREHELALRLALGASRGSLIRQLLIECALLAAFGLGLAVFIAQALSRLLVSLFGQGESLFLDVSFDWRVLSLLAGLAVFSCLLFGLWPALRATRTDPGSVIKGGGHGLTRSRERFSVRRILVISQVALSVVLLVGALLLTQSFKNLVQLDPGFHRKEILIADMYPQWNGFNLEKRTAAKVQLIEALRGIPEVTSVAEAMVTPVSGAAWDNQVWMDGTDAAQGKDILLSMVSAGYFKTLGTSLIAGRDFDDRDLMQSPKVAVVNRAFVRQFIQDADPIGKRYWIEETGSYPKTSYEIVGVVEDAKYKDLKEAARPVAFMATSQDNRFGGLGRILIKSKLPQAELVTRVKLKLSSVEPTMLFSFQSLKGQIEDSLAREQLMALFSGFFGVIAALLAAVGLYGVISYTLSQRTKEIGIRIALGAQRADVFRLVGREGAWLVAIGIGAGLFGALIATRFMSALLYGIGASDPLTFILAIALLAISAALACWFPARRAAKVDPMVALRAE